MASSGEHRTTQRVVVTCPKGHVLGRVFADRVSVTTHPARAGVLRLDEHLSGHEREAEELRADDPWLSVPGAARMASMVGGGEVPEVPLETSVPVMQGLKLDSHLRGWCRRCDQQWEVRPKALAGLIAALAAYGPASTRVSIVSLRDHTKSVIDAAGGYQLKATRQQRFTRVCEFMGI